MNKNQFDKLTRLVRYYILTATTEAGSGHPTSSLSAVDLLTVLYFGGYLRYDHANPDFLGNDRVVFSKGHAAPLLYALWTAAGWLDEAELKTLRKFGSPLEGHPTPAIPWSEVATGSLGQGLSIGFGMALASKYIIKSKNKIYVLLGDSEMTEGSVWEAIQLAAYYKLNNLIGIIDVNRLGQRGETMYGHNLSAYQKRIKAFGWQTVVIDGHDFKQINKALAQAQSSSKPVMIIAKTIKGKGVSFLENKNGWHGHALSQDQYRQAVAELGKIQQVKGKVKKPSKFNFQIKTVKSVKPTYQLGDQIATRQAYGDALKYIYGHFPQLAVLDAEVSNSTFSEIFKQAYPDRFFEMFIAEQNMVGAAVGMARLGLLPFASTFSAFLTRAFDQIRMAQYSRANIKLVGSHAGVSIGPDGSSQMGLEDIAMMRSIRDSVVLYPADATATVKLTELAARHPGIVYLRTTRGKTPVIYSDKDKFVIGGSKVLRRSKQDKVVVLTAGITLFEALQAYDVLKDQGIFIRVIDLYSVKPVDKKTIRQAVREVGKVLVVEDHYPAGGIGEAVLSALAGMPFTWQHLSVEREPHSGTPKQLLNYEKISSSSIINKVKLLTKK